MIYWREALIATVFVALVTGAFIVPVNDRSAWDVLVLTFSTWR